MKYKAIRDFSHFEYADVEADSEEEALKIAEELEDEYWESDPNAEICEDWNYNVELQEED